jgi:hypothetical protein
LGTTEWGYGKRVFIISSGVGEGNESQRSSISRFVGSLLKPMEVRFCLCSSDNKRVPKSLVE